MQPQTTNEQPLSVPRRQMDVEDYIDIVRRHRSWILGPTFACTVLSVVVAFLWPDSFVATGQIRVVPPKVPSKLVPTNVSEEMTQRITSIYQQIISRPVLTNIIQTYNLYPDDRKRLPIEDIIETMRRDINVGQTVGLGRTSNRSGAAFSVSFSYSDKRIATKVCSDLISRFVDESVNAQFSSSTLTTAFLDDQVRAAKDALDEIDKKLTSFRGRYMGQMPDQAQMLMTRVSNLEQSIQNINSSLNRVNQEKLQLETNLRMLREQGAQAVANLQSTGGVSGSASPDPRLVAVDAEIQKLQNTLSVLHESYKDSHPDVQRLLSYLTAKKKQREDLVADIQSHRLEGTGGKGTAAQTPRLPQDIATGIAQVQTAIQAKDLETEDLNKQLNDARARIRQYQSQLEASPAALQEYSGLMGEREMAVQRLEDLTQKMQMSSMASEVEKRQQGETLEILEQPIMPTEPSAPKRELIIGAGVFAGLALGVLLAGARELKDTSLKNLKDVRAYTKLTILGSIPLLENDFVLRRRRRLGWLAWAAAFLVGILLMAGSIVSYVNTRS
jgi:succinoglycan biosynthesis transport protein ExoP